MMDGNGHFPATPVQQVFFSPSNTESDMIYIILGDGRIVYGEWTAKAGKAIWTWNELPPIPAFMKRPKKRKVRK